MADAATSTPVAMLTALRISPAAHMADALAAGSVPDVVELQEVPFLTMIGLRVTPGDEAAQRIGSAVAPLPTSCGETTSFADGAVLWLGPQEYLVVASAGAHTELGGNLENILRDALAGAQGQVVDLSASRTTFELSGPRALDVLQKGCALDLHPGQFPAGTAVSTEIGGIAVILWRTGAETYRLLPRGSFSEFAGRWLLDAMREFAAPTW